MSSETQSEAKEYTGEQVLKMAMHLHQKMAFDGAKQMYARVLDVWPDCSDAVHYSGILAHQQEKDTDRAIALVEKSLVMAPEHPDFHNNYGNLLKAKGRKAEAEAAYRRALELRPDFPDARNNLGLMLQDQKDHEGAIAAFRQIIQDDPNHVVALLNLGNILGILDRWEEAEATYKKAIEIFPNSSEGYYRLARLYWRQDRNEEAIGLFHKSIATDPDRSDAYFSLGEAFGRRGQNEDAVQAFAQSIKIDPTNWVSYHALGLALNLMGRVENAVEVWKRWSEGEPGNPVPRHLLTAGLGKDVPARAQDDYITHSFDNFSDTFDQQLARLQYKAPTIVAEALKKAREGNAGALDILDAGCGTGLCAPLLRSTARTLIGVDLSPGMLEKARERGGYDELHSAELTEFIMRFEQRFDAIISADTLCYFGDLEAVMKAAMRALRPGGHLVFTVEESTGANAGSGFHLALTGRFTHSREYIARAISDAGLERCSITSETLRLEYLKPVQGLVIVARRDA